MNNNKIKFKYLTKEELTINIDRLSRFKLPETSYERVFTSIITRNLISPKYSKADIEKLTSEKISYIIKKIWNESVEYNYGKSGEEEYEYKILKLLIKETFKNIPQRTKKLMDTPIKISAILKDASKNPMPFNLKFLVEAAKNIGGTCNFNDLKSLREEKGLRYPAEKLIIAEGITEEILLPVFAKKSGRDFDKEGIFIIGSGGKSKSPDLYAKVKDKIKIPVILLFDKDAEKIAGTLANYMEKKDKLTVIENGEFEDIISKNLIKRALNKFYEPATPLTKEELRNEKRMCKNIENFFRTRHLGEYKKSAVSKIFAENIKYAGDVSKEIKELFNKI